MRKARNGRGNSRICIETVLAFGVWGEIKYICANKHSLLQLQCIPHCILHRAPNINHTRCTVYRRHTDYNNFTWRRLGQCSHSLWIYSLPFSVEKFVVDYPSVFVFANNNTFEKQSVLFGIVCVMWNVY